MGSVYIYVYAQYVQFATLIFVHVLYVSGSVRHFFKVKGPYSQFFLLSSPSFFHLYYQSGGCLFFLCMGSLGWTVAVPAIGALFSLVAGCQRGKHMDIPGT